MPKSIVSHWIALAGPLLRLWHPSNPGRCTSAREPHFSSLISGRLVHPLIGPAFTWGHSLGTGAPGLIKSWIKHIWHFLDKTRWNLVSFCSRITDGRSRRCHILTVSDTDMYYSSISDRETSFRGNWYRMSTAGKSFTRSIYQWLGIEMEVYREWNSSGIHAKFGASQYFH